MRAALTLAALAAASGAVEVCVDPNPTCGGWAEHGLCEEDPAHMAAACPCACGAKEAAAALAAAAPCADDHPQCAAWAGIGECEENPSYMLVNCPKACGTCHLRDPAVRCRRGAADGPAPPPALAAGALGATFRRAVAAFPELGPRVLSSDPWVVVFDTFVSAAEAAAVAEGGGDARFEFARSSDAGAKGANGQFKSVVSTSRTSSTSWCVRPECAEHPLVRRVGDRIANVTGVPYENAEYLQVLRYEPGQYYVEHHDYIPGHKQMPCGPRLYTLLVYLADVEQGGGTDFPRLGLTVQPKLGRAVLWPSVLEADPAAKDPRTMHEALPVEAGVKLAANAWLHMNEFKRWHAVGCTG